MKKKDRNQRSSLDAELLTLYLEKAEEIQRRLHEFRLIYEYADDMCLFEELAFCTLTPQAKPLEAEKTIKHLKQLELLWKGDPEDISPHLHRVRFRHTKAYALVYNRQQCFGEKHFSLRKQLEALPNGKKRRQWLVQTMRGIGWKEASHFLRNTGFNLDLAILDRHVLRMLQKRFDEKLPSSLHEKRYLIYEEKLREWSELLGIPFPALDFVIFFQKTGIIFK